MPTPLPAITTGNNTDMGDIGEAQITPQVLEQITPDLLQGEGLTSLMQTLKNAKQASSPLSKSLQQIANDLKGKMEHRVKQGTVVLQKIAQKRLEDRNYGIKNINDAWGGRIIINKPSDEKRAIDLVHKAAEAGDFTIKKEQPIDKDTYHAYHFDIQYKLPTGKTVNGEIQIHTPQSVAQAAVTHDAHYVYGENPPDNVQDTLNQQTDTVQNLPNAKAQQLADQLVGARKQNNDQPLPPIVIQKAVDMAEGK